VTLQRTVPRLPHATRHVVSADQPSLCIHRHRGRGRRYCSHNLIHDTPHDTPPLRKGRN
jgi:hypothetical protein